MSLPLLYIPLGQVAVGNLHEWNTGGTKAGIKTLQEPPGSCAGKGVAGTQRGEASGQHWISRQGDPGLQKQPEEESSSKLADEETRTMRQGCGGGMTGQGWSGALGESGENRRKSKMAAGRCLWDVTASWSCPSQVKTGSWEKAFLCPFLALIHRESDRLLLSDVRC